jgi:hypothetical protein
MSFLPIAWIITFSGTSIAFSVEDAVFPTFAMVALVLVLGLVPLLLLLLLLLLLPLLLLAMGAVMSAARSSASMSSKSPSSSAVAVLETRCLPFFLFFGILRKMYINHPNVDVGKFTHDVQQRTKEMQGAGFSNVGRHKRVGKGSSGGCS